MRIKRVIAATVLTTVFLCTSVLASPQLDSIDSFCSFCDTKLNGISGDLDCVKQSVTDGKKLIAETVGVNTSTSLPTFTALGDAIKSTYHSRASMGSSAGSAAGDSVGYSNGKTNGYNDGYNSGYKDGYADGPAFKEMDIGPCGTQVTLDGIQFVVLYNNGINAGIICKEKQKMTWKETDDYGNTYTRTDYSASWWICSNTAGSKDIAPYKAAANHYNVIGAGLPRRTLVANVTSQLSGCQIATSENVQRVTMTMNGMPIYESFFTYMYWSTSENRWYYEERQGSYYESFCCYPFYTISMKTD